MIPLLTAIIAAFVALIAWLQWRTAQEKVLLDLFDRRFALYEELRAVVGRHLSSGIDQTALFDFKRASSRAQFLFGPEVTTFLEERWTDLSREMVAWKLTPRPVPEAQREAAEAALIARKDRLSDFFKDLDELVSPYMKHHQSTQYPNLGTCLLTVVKRARVWDRRLSGER